MIGLEAKRIGEIFASRAQLEWRKGGAVHCFEATHLPSIDPGVKRFGIDAGLAYAAAGKGLAEAMGVDAGDRSMPHPDLLIGPSFRLRARMHGLAKQGPLRAIGRAIRIAEIGGHIPPLDAKIRMWAVIGGKDEFSVGSNGRKAVSAHPQSGKALRKPLFVTQGQNQRARNKATSRYRTSSAHRRKP